MHFHVNMRDTGKQPVSLGTFAHSAFASQIFNAAVSEDVSLGWELKDTTEILRGQRAELVRETPLGTVERSHCLWACSCTTGEAQLSRSPLNN